MFDDEEHKFWQAKEDAEQVGYLNWLREQYFLKKAISQSPRLGEEYRLARRLCLGYVCNRLEQRQLLKVLDASFILDCRPVALKGYAQKAIAGYFDTAERRKLCKWRQEKDCFLGQIPMSCSQALSPVAVARLFAQKSGKKPKDDVYTASDMAKANTPAEDLAVFFGQESQYWTWNHKAQAAMDCLAVDLMKQHLTANSDSKPALRKLVWQEMQGVATQAILTPFNILKFSLVGRAGQQLGVNVADELLVAHQKDLAEKPQLQKILTYLSGAQKKRRPLLERIGLARVVNKAR